MFEDYTFSFSWPHFLTKFNRITWLLLAATMSGFLIAGYGIFHLVFVQEIKLTAPGAVLGTTSLLGTIYVDVSGAVEQPGLYQLQAGDRVAQALEKAGGLSLEADLQFIAQELNVARKLEDGEKLFIPFLADRLPDKAADAMERSNTLLLTSGRLLSLNTASQSELETLPQVGEKRAIEIIQNRPYTMVTELMDKGIVTEKVFKEIEELISI